MRKRKRDRERVGEGTGKKKEGREVRKRKRFLSQRIKRNSVASFVNYIAQLCSMQNICCDFHRDQIFTDLECNGGT